MISSLQGEGRGYISIKACAVGSRLRNGGSDMKAIIKYPGREEPMEQLRLF